MGSSLQNKSLLVITSTFPRWANDTEPPFVFELSKRLFKSGFDIDVIAPHTKNAKRYEIIDDIKVHRYVYFFPKYELLAYTGGIMSNIRNNRLLYFLVPFFVFSQAIAIGRYLNLKRYDAIHVHWIIPQGFICALVCMFSGKKMPPILCTSHGGDLFSLRSFLLIKIKKWTLKKMKKVTVVSHYMRNYCVEKMSLDINKISVVPMGVDLVNLFRPVENVQRKHNRVIFVGRLVEKKGVVNLIEAISQVRNIVPDVELILVGNGPLRGALEEKVEEYKLNNNVKFIGSVQQKELPALYSSASIAVTPSIVDVTGDQEGLGLVIIEALGCGCVVVASALEAIKDIIADGENGLLVKPGDVASLVEAIQRVLKDLDICRELSKKGIKSVYSKYDWNFVAKRYHDLIMDMVKEDIH